MALATNSAVEYFGTQSTVTASGGTSSVVSGDFSATADLETGGWTNAENSPMASVVLTGVLAGLPASAGKSINLFARLMDIDGTSDQEIPSSDFKHVYLGYFPIGTTTTISPTPIDVRLPNNYSGQIYEFYLENTAGVTLNAGWTLKVQPKTIGPKA